MAYVTVPKDLTKIKSKMLFGLTKRQLVCFGSAALVGVPLFFLSKGSMGTTPAALCMILVMLPFFLFALYEKNGQTPEALLGNLIQCKFTRPKKRVYQTNNAYSALEKQAELERTVGRIASGAGKRGKGRRRLTRQERKQIEAVIRQAKGDGKNHTVQASLPFRNMHPDGLCRLDDRHFSKTIAYADVSYRLAGPDDQRDIFERLCDFYNGYDPSIGVQMTLSSSHKAGGGDLFRMAAQGDELDGIRAEASGILQTQYERGSNGYVKSKYVTLTIEAESIQAARARFSRIEADTLNRFKVMGAAAKVLDGKERLALLHGLLHPRGEPFAFEWDWLPASGLSVKDFIAPSSFEFGETRRFRMGEMYGAVSFLQILAPEIQDRILTDFMDVEGNLLVTMHVRGINQNEAIKMVKRKITDLDAMKIQEQKKAARSGYDLDILPSDLSTYGGAAKNLLQDLQSRNERMFNMTFLMLHLAPTKQKLEIAVSQSASVAQTHNCILTRLDFQQEDGLMSSLPLGLNRIRIERSLTTSALAVFVPFVTQELFMGGDAMYYGLNALSGNMILLDRKQSRCPNGLVFGTPGSGKSMSCKREITYVMLTTKDNVIICDPEDEYSPLVNRLGGQVIRLSPNSRDYVNPLDINLNYSEEENPLALKSDFVLSFCELIMGSKTGLEAIEKTVIDRAVQKIYQPYFADPRPENMPILSDLMAALTAQHIPEAERAGPGAGPVCERLSQLLQPPDHRGYPQPPCLLRHQGAWQEPEKARDAHCPGRGVEHRHGEPLHWAGHLVFRGRVPFALEGGTDGGIQRRDLEAFQKVGRRPDRGNAEPERPAFLTGDRKHSGKQRFYLFAEPLRRRPQADDGAAEHLRRAACLCDQRGPRQRPSVLPKCDSALQGRVSQDHRAIQTSHDKAQRGFP